MKFFIKEVTIKGFKSFRDEKVVKHLNPAYNVLVGRSGSGKSNFFDAIMMVLEPSQSFLKSRDRALERRRLLYDSNEPASIKVVFDDREGRLYGYLVSKGKIEEGKRPYISVERIFDSESDIFIVNRKKMSSNDVAEMFKVAGLPPVSSQFYIKQDMINNLAINAYSGILELLLAFTGLKESGEQAASFSSEIRTYFRAIDSLLSKIREFLARSQNQEEQLVRNQHLKQREQALKYLIVKNEFEDRRKQLDEIENEMRNLKTDKLAPSRVRLGKDRVKVQEASLTYADNKIDFDGFNEKLNILRSCLVPLIQDHTNLSLGVAGLMGKISLAKQCEEEATKTLDELREPLIQTKEEIEMAKALIKSFEEKEYDCLLQLTIKRRKRQHLLDKQSRFKHFTTKEERDRWITAELMSLDGKIMAKLAKTSKVRESIQKKAENLAEWSSNVTGGLIDQMVDFQENIVQISKEWHTLKEKRDAQQWKIRDLRNKTDSILRKETLLKLKPIEADQKLLSPAAAKDLCKGLESLTKVFESFKSQGGRKAELAEKSYHGMVIDNFDCAWAIDLAVELSAGIRLFDHIVDSEDVSREILSEIQRQNLPGKVNFTCLNHVTRVQRFQRLEPEVSSVLSHLEYDPKFKNVMLDVFGRTLICPTAACASRQAAASGLNCLTLEGRLVSPNGTETIRPVKVFSCREMRRNRMALMEKIKNLSKGRERLKTKLVEEERKTAEVLHEMRQLKEKLENTRETYNQLKHDHPDRMAEARLISFCKEDEVVRTKCKLVDWDLDIAGMQTTKENLESELLQELVELSDEEQKQLDTLKDEIFALQQQKNRLYIDRCQFESNKRVLDEKLKHLIRQEDRVRLDIFGIFVEQEEQLLNQMKCDLAKVFLKRQGIQEAIREVKMNLQAARNVLRTLQQEKKDYFARMKESRKEVEQVANNLSAKADAHYKLKEKVAEDSKRLSVLKSAADSKLVQKFSRWSSQRMYNELGKLVHKTKDIDMLHIDASIDVEHYCRRLTEIEKENESFLNERAILERCSILREDSRNNIFGVAFSNLRESFARIFKELVPEGYGELALINSAGAERQTVDGLAYTQFVGVAVRVSFDQFDELHDIGEFSRGQITLVSLALIFALHEVVPSPTILLDEVDQALSVQSALTLAALVRKHEGQIIVSTYKAEIAAEAHQFFRFKLQSLMSYVKTVSRPSALSFLTDGQQRIDDADSEEA